MSLFARLEAQAAARPDAPCLLGPGGCDWAGFLPEARRVASVLAPERGRVVAFQLPDGPGLVMHLVGAWAAGAIAFPLPLGATAHERERLLDGLDVARLVSAPLEGGDPEATLAPVEDGAIGLLVGTSGSTGRPKRVALHHAGLVWNAEAHTRALGLGEGVRTLVVSPLYHAFPLVAQVLGTLLNGGAVGFLASPFTPKGLLKAIAADAYGYAALTPTTLQLLRERCPKAALPAVLSVGAAPVAASELVAAEAWARANGARLYHTYGLSEAGPRVATLAPEDIPARAGSVGRLLSGVEARLVDPETGREALDGELWLKTPSRMAGYYPDFEGLEADGWLRTGDRARLDQGFLTLTGRLKDVVVVGGVNVSLREIEEAIALHPGVTEAAAVGVPHPAYGEGVRACVVAAESLTRQDVLDHLVGLLSRQKLPHDIRFLDRLPRTALGKVDKSQLKELP